MSYKKTGATIRMMLSFENSTPHIVAPPLLMLVQGGYATVIMLFLFIAVFIQLGHGSIDDLSVAWLFALAGFVLPYLLGYGLSCNRAWTRWAIPLSAIVLTFSVVQVLLINTQTAELVRHVQIAGALVTIVSIAICYLRVDTEIYYLEISHAEVPADLRERLKPKQWQRWSELARSIEEHLVTVGIVIIVGALLYAFRQMG